MTFSGPGQVNPRFQLRIDTDPPHQPDQVSLSVCTNGYQWSTITIPKDNLPEVSDAIERAIRGDGTT